MLEDDLVRIVDTPAFQRLRRLEQLGTASLVFPGARHTRFEHSLGAQEIMRRAVEQIEDPVNGGEIEDTDKRILRVAALVHDLGHYPLSHVIEYVVYAIETHIVGDASRLKLQQQPAGSRTYANVDIEDESWWLHIAASAGQVERMSAAHHEAVTARILENDSVLAEAIEAYVGHEGAIAKVTNVLQKTTTEKYKRQLVSSELDVDRLDYLVRDSYYTGVTFGAVEASHLIRRLGLIELPESNQRLVVVDERALPHLEHYLLARHFMYSQVAYHKAVTAFSVLAGAVWIALYKNNVEKTSISSIHEAMSNGEYGSFDDTWFWQKVAYLSTSKHAFSAKLALDLLQRRPPALAFEERGRGLELLGMARARFESKRSALASDSGLKPEYLFLTDQTIRIATELSKEQFDEMVEFNVDHLPDDIPYIVRQSGDVIPVTGIEGSIAQRLSANEDREQIIRVYCLQDDDLDTCEFNARLAKLDLLCREAFRLS